MSSLRAGTWVLAVTIIVLLPMGISRSLVPTTSGAPPPLGVTAATGQVSITPSWAPDPQYPSGFSATNPPVAGPPGLFGPSLASDPVGGTVLLFGGSTSVIGGGYSNSTWLFRDGIWVQQNTTPTPPAREYAGLVYDSILSEFLLYGGRGSSGTLNDTWAYSNGTWSNLTNATNPGPRTEASMAYDSTDGVVVLFGGFNCFLSPCDTWTYGTTGWHNSTTGPQPGARYDAMMADDPAQGEVVLYGGSSSSSGSYLADTWGFSTSGWTQINGSAPPLRSQGQFAWDPAVQGDILYGGDYVTLSNFPGVTYGDTWKFTGSWTELSSSGGPPPLFQGAAAFSPNDGGNYLLVGGCGPSACANAETYELGSPVGVTAYTAPSTCGSVKVGDVSVSDGTTVQVPLGVYSLNVSRCQNETVPSPTGAQHYLTGFTFGGGVNEAVDAVGAYGLAVTASGSVKVSFTSTPSVQLQLTPSGCSTAKLRIDGHTVLSAGTVRLAFGNHSIAIGACLGHSFTGWVGSGPNVTVADPASNNTTVAVNGSGSLEATFTSPTTGTASSSLLANPYLLIGIPVVVVVGVAVGVLALRRRPPAPPPTEALPPETDPAEGEPLPPPEEPPSEEPLS